MRNQKDKKTAGERTQVKEEIGSYSNYLEYFKDAKSPEELGLRTVAVYDRERQAKKSKEG